MRVHARNDDGQVLGLPLVSYFVALVTGRDLDGGDHQLARDANVDAATR